MSDVSFIIKNKTGDVIEQVRAEEFRQWQHRNTNAAIVVHSTNDKSILIEDASDIDLPSGTYQGTLVKKMLTLEKH